MGEVVKETKYKILIKRDVKTKDGKKTFDSYTLVDEENGGKKIDTVVCKSVDPTKLKELRECNKAYITGDISVNMFGYEYPKAFIRSIDTIEKIR